MEGRAALARKRVPGYGSDIGEFNPSKVDVLPANAYAQEHNSGTKVVTVGGGTTGGGTMSGGTTSGKTMSGISGALL